MTHWTNWYSMSVMRSNSGGAWTGAYSEPTEWWYMMMNGSVELSQTTGTYSDNSMRDHWHNCY